MPETKKIRVGSVTMILYPWREAWRFAWHDEQGRRRYTTRKSLQEAKRAARDRAHAIQNALPDIAEMQPLTKQRLSRLLNADPELDLIEDYLRACDQSKPSVSVSEAREQFIELKRANKGRSVRNVQNLESHLRPFISLHGDRPMSSLSVRELNDYLLRDPKHSPKTRKQHRGSLVTFFRWAARSGYLPEGITNMERTEQVIVPRSIPSTWSPGELATMLEAVDPKFLGWLACAAFGGFRSDELCTVSPGKSPLDWSDFQWDRGNIRVRPETDKNGKARNVAILPALAAWLEPIKEDSGPICPSLPWRPGKNGKPSETARLGKLVGGWRRNALRHSWISYRAAEIGLALTAKEAGNSESEARKSYDDAKTQAEAKAWFSVLPD